MRGRNRCYWNLAIALGVGFLTSNARASLITVETGDGAGADTYVRQGQATTNFGTSSVITVKDSGNSIYTRKGYLRFDLSPVTESVISSTLEVTVGSSDGGSYTILVDGLSNEALDSWGESTINWNNAPANDVATGGNGLTGDATSLGSFTIPSGSTGTTFQFTSAALDSFIQSDTNDLATIILRRSGGNSSHNLSFASKEDGSFAAPTLTVLTVPEPASAAGLFFLLGGFVTVFRRRRHLLRP